MTYFAEQGNMSKKRKVEEESGDEVAQGSDL